VRNRAAIAALVAFGIAAAEGIAAGPVPERARGFSGQVRGVVKAKGEKDTFTLYVEQILNVWKTNKAADPNLLVDCTVTVGPRWMKTESGVWRPDERHAAFIRGLEEGRRLDLEIVNLEGRLFVILELPGEARRQSAEDERKAPPREEAEPGPIESRRLEKGEGGWTLPPGEPGGVIRKTEGIAALEAEVRRLREENAELRRKLAEKERGEGAQ